MARVATYVFIDLETTGLPAHELNKTRIIELSMVAVKRLHLEDSNSGSVPRVQHKLTLCITPKRFISEGATKVTGLCNDLLLNEPHFNLDVFNMINTFLNILTAPVCLVAYNGFGFDFPILKNHLEKLNVSFSDDLLCADCFHGFYDILEGKPLLQVNNEDSNTDTSITQQIIQNGGDNVILHTNSPDKSPSNSTTIPDESPPTSKSVDDIDFFSPNLNMQTVNETTPKHNRFRLKRKIDSKVCRRMPWEKQKKPEVSYKLEHVYERVVQKMASGAHRAESDCIFALEIAAHLSDKFVEWVDSNHVEFSEIKPMTIGVKLGF